MLISKLNALLQANNLLVEQFNNKQWNLKAKK